MEQVGMFLGQTAEFFGNYWWVWLLGMILSFLGYCGCSLCLKILLHNSPDKDDETDPEPPVFERGLIEDCRVAVWLWGIISFGFLLAFVVGAGYRFMVFIFRSSTGG